MSKLDVEDLYKRYGFAVFRRCTALLGKEEDAMDAMQEVFIKTLKYGHSFNNKKKPLPWLFQIANRICFDMLGRQKREQSYDLTNFGDNGHSRPEYQAIVIDLLKKYDAKTREIVLYYYLEEMTMEEISKRIGISRKTIGKRINKFSRSIHELLQSEKV